MTAGQVMITRTRAEEGNGRLAGALLIGVMAVGSFALWTVVPLLCLWASSTIAGSSAEEYIIASAAGEDIVAGAANEHVVTVAAVDCQLNCPGRQARSLHGVVAIQSRATAVALVAVVVAAAFGSLWARTHHRANQWRPIVLFTFVVAACAAGCLAWYAALRGARMVTWNPTPRPNASTA